MTDVDSTRATAARIPLRQTLAGLRDPLTLLSRLGEQHYGQVVQLNLGAFQPYLLTEPDHIQHVVRDHPTKYVREGMIWEPVRRLEGNGIAGEGPQWEHSRQLLEPNFSRQALNPILTLMAEEINSALREWATNQAGPVDFTRAAMRVVYRALIRAFFGGQITRDDADRLGDAISAAFTSLNWRMAAPFVPATVPVPGDRRFAAAVRMLDEVMYPLVRRARERGPAAGDIVSMLAAARNDDGSPPTDTQIRDDAVATFVGGTETTALTLTWMVTLIDSHPYVARQMQQEIDDVVGPGPVTGEHAGQLRYTRSIVEETLRLYPPGWLIPRLCKEDDVIGGVSIPSGATVLLSPYVTHRLPQLWDRPLDFDPDRFTPVAGGRRHRYAYFPFSGGPHRCLGNHLVLLEAPLIAAAIYSAYRPVLTDPKSVRPRAFLTLRPAKPVPVTLQPR